MNGEKSIVVRLNAHRIVLGLSLMALLVLIASITGQLVKYVYGGEQFTELIEKLYIDAEGNIPTFYSSSILLIASMLLGAIYIFMQNRRDSFRFHWLALGGVFLFLAIDESALLYHDVLRSTLTAFNNTATGRTSVAIIAILFMILFLHQSIKFFLHLSNRYRILFVISAAVYFAGAVGMDKLGTMYHEVHGKYNLTYSMLATVETMLEMSGIIFFIHTLLMYLSDLTGDYRTREVLPEESQEGFNNKNRCSNAS